MSTYGMRSAQAPELVVRPATSYDLSYRRPTKDQSLTTNTGIPLIYSINGRIKANEVATLHERVMGTFFSIDEWKKELADTYATLSVRTHNERGMLVGFVRVTQDPADPDKYIGDDAMIRPQYQGRKIFKRMIALGINYLQEQGAHELSLRNNPGTESLYQSLGFTAINGLFSLKLDQISQGTA